MNGLAKSKIGVNVMLICYIVGSCEQKGNIVNFDSPYGLTYSNWKIVLVIYFKVYKYIAFLY